MLRRFDYRTSGAMRHAELEPVRGAWARRCPLVAGSPEPRASLPRKTGGGDRRRRGPAASTRINFAPDALQIRAHFRGKLIARLAVFLERLGDHPLQFRRHIGVQPHRRNRRRVQNGLEDHTRAFAAERGHAGGHFVEHIAK